MILPSLIIESRCSNWSQRAETYQGANITTPSSINGVAYSILTVAPVKDTPLDREEVELAEKPPLPAESMTAGLLVNNHFVVLSKKARIGNLGCRIGCGVRTCCFEFEICEAWMGILLASMIGDTISMTFSRYYVLN